MTSTAKKRAAKRKTVDKISISNITTLLHFEKIASKAVLVDASSSGFLMHIDRKDLIPEHLRQNLSIESVDGEPVVMVIEQMDLELSGRIARTKYVGKGLFEVAVDFSDDAPEYWRECLFDLLS